MNTTLLLEGESSLASVGLPGALGGEVLDIEIEARKSLTNQAKPV